MKKSINVICINVICIMIFIVILSSLVQPLYDFGYSFGQGLRAGIEAAETNTTTILDNHSVLSVEFLPKTDKIISNPDKLTLLNSDEDLNFIIEQGSIYVSDDCIPMWISLLETVMYLAMIVVFIILIVKFVKFINNINKNKVFEKINVKLLKQMGLILLSMSIIQIVLLFSSKFIVSTLSLEIEGYSISSSMDFPWTVTLIGLVALLMAQVWAKGIQMREEQELTI